MYKFFISPEFNNNTVNLYISSSGIATICASESWQANSLAFSRLHYIKSGEQRVTVNGKTIHFRAGYVYLLPSGISASRITTADTEQLFFHVNLFDFLGTDILSKCTDLGGIPCNRIEHMFDLYRSTDQSDLFELRNLVAQDLIRFLRMNRISVSLQDHSPCVVMAVNYIKENLSARLTAKEVSEKLFISQSTLNRHFHQELHQSISDYIDSLIIERAKILLTSKSESLLSISETLGFSDQFYFSRRFREKCGETPSAYRKRNQPF